MHAPFQIASPNVNLILLMGNSNLDTTMNAWHLGLNRRVCCAGSKSVSFGFSMAPVAAGPKRAGSVSFAFKPSSQAGAKPKRSSNLAAFQEAEPEGPLFGIASIRRGSAATAAESMSPSEAGEDIISALFALSGMPRLCADVLLPAEHAVAALHVVLEG